jgi:energy-converting hydrogenase B subunit Q
MTPETTTRYATATISVQRRNAVDGDTAAALLTGFERFCADAEARVLVLAGALMGGAITDAVKEVQSLGIIVIALNMVGSVREVADLVVTDPLQAGVMAVMAIADTARFDISRQRRRQY